MRFFTFFFFSSLVSLTACTLKDDDDAPRPQAGMMVFGVTQRTDPATGETLTTAGYEVLSVGWDASSFGPYAASRQSLPDGWCRRWSFEPKANDTHTGDGGRAKFSGGLLLAAPLVVDANAAAATHVGAVFDRQASPLRFGVERGFGLPAFDPVELRTPNAALRVRMPAAEEGNIVVDTNTDVSFAWTPGEDRHGIVMVAIEPDDETAPHLRCWFAEAEGKGVVKADQLSGLRDGKITVSSHRNAPITPGDGWLVEVVATIVAAEQRFVVR
jgi:hypothetical protein